MIKKVKKRDGKIVDFDKEKIVNAIFKAAEAVGGKDRKEAERVADLAVQMIDEKFKEDYVPSVEDIQDLVEKALIEAGHASTAKAYILYRHKKTVEREMKKILGVQDDLKLPLNSIQVLERRYLLKDEAGKVVETPSQLFKRVAHFIASNEKEYGADGETVKEYEDAFFQIMTNFEFLPNSPTLMNAGTNLGQLAACFVLPVEDDIPAIFDAVKYTAIIHQSGGGTGFSFSHLRPNGDFVKSTSGVASGPLSFMRVFDVATDVVKQGGKRRGANMGVLNVWHPDIEDFITMKQTPGVFENFNISVAVDDAFMKAVDANTEYKLINPRTGEPMREINARSLYKLIAYSAWKSAEPGLLFIDTINRVNPTPQYEIHATNPCLSGDALVTTKRGLVRLDELHNPDEVLTIDGNYHKISWAGKTGKKVVFKVSTEDGHAICATADHKFFIANAEWKPLSELKKGEKLVVEKEGAISDSKIKEIQKIGIKEVFDATEPLTHSFFANGILVHNCGEVPMPDYESCNLGSINLEKFVEIDWTRGDWKKKVNWKRLRYTVRLAVQFLDNVIDLNKYPIAEIRKRTLHHRRMGLGVMGFAKMLFKMGVRYDSEGALEIGEGVMKFVTDEARKMSHELGRARGSFPGFKESTLAKKYDAMRNATVTSIAPTGTISMIADTSSGIEPMFALAYIKNVMDGTKLYYSDEIFEHVLKIRGLYTTELMQKIIEEGTIQALEEVPRELREVFVVAHDIKSDFHVKMQAVFQKHTDLAVSKTINMPAEASVEDVENSYMLAWKLGCKGITIYREGSRGEGVFRKVKKAEAQKMEIVMEARE